MMSVEPVSTERLTQKRAQQFPVIVLGHGLLDEAHVLLLAMRLAALILGIDHGDA